MRAHADRLWMLGGAIGVILLVLIVGVMAPVFEEIFYRGLMQRSLLKRGLPPVLAVGTTAVVFGATHFQLLQLPGLIAAGAVFGTLAYRAGRGIKAGRVWTNCYHLYPAHAAFGGYKQSGIGRENHKMMLDHYQQTKNLLVSYSPKAMGFF